MSLGRKRWRKQDWQHWETATKVLTYCGEKICYATEQEAYDKIAQQGKKWGIGLWVYRCDRCSYHHLTSKAQYV